MTNEKLHESSPEKLQAQLATLLAQNQELPTHDGRGERMSTVPAFCPRCGEATGSGPFHQCRSSHQRSLPPDPITPERCQACNGTTMVGVCGRCIMHCTCEPPTTEGASDE